MIEKMLKYTFLLHHLDYIPFLTELQKLGMVHIIKSTPQKSEKLLATQQSMEAYSADIKFMQRWVTDKTNKKQTTLLAPQMKTMIEQAHAERDRMQTLLNILSKEMSELEPWGNFSLEMLKGLEAAGLQISLFFCSKSHFKAEWKERYALQELNLISNQYYFAILHKLDEPVQIEAEQFKLPPKMLSEVKKQEKEVRDQLANIEEFYRNHALAAIELFETEIKLLTKEYEFEEATIQAAPEADNQIMVLQGWIPKRLDKDLNLVLQKSSVVHFNEPGVVDDNPPILLKNNWFAKIFEPIGNMFMLPYYNEIDMTPFLAPFYMMFFGFCSGDAGYGIVLFILGWLLKKKIKNPAARPFLTLIQTLGIGTVIMGFVMGSFFSFDMKLNKTLEPFIPIKNYDQIFNFALLLGLIQIITGKIINAVKQMIQSGFVHGLATLGMVFFILSLAISGSTMLGAKPGALLQYAPYGMYLGLAMIFLLNSPGKNILCNIANGIWVMYGVLTGFFGDILSYIRLFALGVSGGILGFVINTMAAQFGAIPVIGPVIYILFMVGGHGLNVALSSLGAFVHPMRLTFVEFFNNSGFSGPGMQYKPFGKKN